MPTLIAGCGYVGSELARLLTQDGDAVFAVRRNAALLPDCVTAVAIDLDDSRSLRALPTGIEQVVYARSPGERSDEAYRRTYVEGLANLIGALQATKATLRRFVLTTSTAVYAQMDGSVVDEASPCAPVHFSGKRLLEAEKLLLGSGLPGVCLRLAGIYGPGRTGLLERLRRGEATYDAVSPHYTNRIHRDDCARVIRHVLSLSTPDPIYVGVDDEPAPEEQVLRWLAGALGVPGPLPSTPNSERSKSNKRCSNQRLRATGYRFEYPTFRDGYAKLLVP